MSISLHKHSIVYFILEEYSFGVISAFLTALFFLTISRIFSFIDFELCHLNVMISEASLSVSHAMMLAQGTE